MKISLFFSKFNYVFAQVFRVRCHHPCIVHKWE